jgi:hypothetical protein
LIAYGDLWEDFIDRHANIPAAGSAGKMVWLEKRQ